METYHPSEPFDGDGKEENASEREVNNLLQNVSH